MCGYLQAVQSFSYSEPLRVCRVFHFFSFVQTFLQTTGPYLLLGGSFKGCLFSVLVQYGMLKVLAASVASKAGFVLS